jgi:DnaA-homolog protein
MVSTQHACRAPRIDSVTQLLLDIAPDARPTLESFVPGRNAELLEVLRGLVAGTQREGFVYLWGGPASGRTHLLKAAADALRARYDSVHYLADESALEAARGLERLGCVAVDDVQRLGAAGQESLFHLYNRMREGGRAALLAAGDAAPGQLPLREDLVTRLAWGLVYQVHGLSDEEKAQALGRHAAARGFALPQEVSEYLLRHGRRELPWLISVVDALDRYSLEMQRPVTLPLLREIMQTPLDLQRRA